MIFIPTVLGFLAAVGLYKYTAATDPDINTLSPSQIRARNAKVDRTINLIIGLPVAGMALSAMLWLGPDGFEKIREFTAPRIVIVNGK